MTEFLTVATANTHMGRLFKKPGGLDQLADCEAVGFQEVHPERDMLEARLSAETDLMLSSVAPEFGLAIAVHKDFVTANEYKRVLQKRGPVGRSLMDLEARNKTAFRTRARGVHGVTIETPKGEKLNFANAHPIIPFKPHQRHEQLRRLPIVLAHLTGKLVLVMDANHYPGPRPADLAMRHSLGLTPVDIKNEPTYVMNRSKHAWLGIVPLKHKTCLQFDDILYRGDGLREVHTEVIDIESDHRAIKTTFALNTAN